jgi:hypothetical protein
MALPTPGPHHPQRREILVRQKARGDAVGGDHEVLDELLGAVLLLGGEVLDLVCVKHRPRLDGLQVEGAVLVPERPELLRHRVLEPQVGVQAGDRGNRFRHRPVALQPGRDVVVGKLCVVVDEGLVEVGAIEGAVLPDRHLDRDRRPILLVGERREVGGKPFGQHGKGLGRRVDRGRVGLRVSVDGRPLGHQSVHVRDRHQHPDRAVRQRLRHGELVKVERLVVVDRGPAQVTQVVHRRRGRERRTHLRQLSHHRGRKVGLQAAVEHRLVRDPS